MGLTQCVSQDPQTWSVEAETKCWAPGWAVKRVVSWPQHWLCLYLSTFSLKQMSLKQHLVVGSMESGTAGGANAGHRTSSWNAAAYSTVLNNASAFPPLWGEKVAAT